MTKYYLDVSIWKDYWEDRKDNLRPLGDFAFQLLKKIMESKDKLIYSPAVIEELLSFFSENEIENRFFKDFRELGLLNCISINNKQIQEAEEIARNKNLPVMDALHAVLARDNNAILVSRDKHFEKLTDVTVSKKPEEII